jgi:hypothetical protein
MERVFGLLVIVAILFVGVELYTKGDQAFGGTFASADAPAAADDPSWAGDRAGARLRDGHDERAERMERALGE